MKAWEEIVNTAILGTDKKRLNTQGFPEELAQVIAAAEQALAAEDKEAQFLGAAAIVYNYRRGGMMPLREAPTPLAPCEAETQPYCSAEAAAALGAALGEDVNSLLYFWLLQCARRGQVVRPEHIPALLEIAAHNPALQTLVVACTGKRGAWMQQFNEDWDFHVATSFKETFDHGSLNERTEALRNWRLANPAEARDALAGAWKQESAANKTELLEALEVGLGPDDEPFLQEAWKEKSQKVKEVALSLLQQIPGSAMVKEVWEFVRPLLVYGKKGGVLGLGKKEVLEVNLAFEVPEHFKAYGISTLDADKVYSEKEYTLKQLIGFVPPKGWEAELGLSPKEILDLLDKRKETKKFIPALAAAADTFRDAQWGLLLYQHDQSVCPSVVKEFARPLQEEIFLANLQAYGRDVYAILPDKEAEWSQPFVRNLLGKTLQEPYVYGKAYYKGIVHHFPTAILGEIDAITASLKNSYWESMVEDLKRMLAIKQQIQQAF